MESLFLEMSGSPVGRNLVFSGEPSETAPHTDFQKITGRFSVV